MGLLGELWVSVTAKDVGYAKALADAEAKAKRTEAALNALEKPRTPLQAARLAAKQATAELDKLRASAVLTAPALGNVGETFLKMLATIGSVKILGHVMNMEEAFFSLKGTLQATGQEVEANADRILHLSKVLAETTGRTKESYLDAAKQAAYMGVPAGKMESFLRVAEGLAQIMGTNLTQGMRAATQAEYGYYLMLQRRLPMLRGMTSASEKLAYTLAEAKIGYAAAQVSSLTRAIRTSTQSFWNLIWDALQPLLPVLTDVIHAIGSALRPMAEWLRSHKAVTTALIASVVALGLLVTIVPAVTLLIKALTLAKIGYVLACTPELALAAALAAALYVVGNAIYKIISPLEEAEEGVKKLTDISPWKRWQLNLAGILSWLEVALTRVYTHAAHVITGLDIIGATVQRFMTRKSSGQLPYFVVKDPANPTQDEIKRYKKITSDYEKGIDSPEVKAARLAQARGDATWEVVNDELNKRTKKWEAEEKLLATPFKTSQNTAFNEMLKAMASLVDTAGMTMDDKSRPKKGDKPQEIGQFTGGGLVNLAWLNPASFEQSLLETMRKSNDKLDIANQHLEEISSGMDMGISLQ